MKQQFDFSLSASKLNIYAEDPLLFWLIEKEILEKPDEIIAGILGAIDRKTKAYFDQFRGQLPPQLIGKVSGVLDPELLSRKWRSWQSFQIVLTINGKRVRVLGMLDDVLVDTSSGQPMLTPLDNKTKGSRPKDNGARYYQRQVDVYALILQELGHQVSGKAVLHYMWPTEIKSQTAANERVLQKPSLTNMEFDSEVFILDAKPDRALTLITEAIACLEDEHPPIPTKNKLSGVGDNYHWWTSGRQERNQRDQQKKATTPTSQPVATG